MVAIFWSLPGVSIGGDTIVGLCWLGKKFGESFSPHLVTVTWNNWVPVPFRYTVQTMRGTMRILR